MRNLHTCDTYVRLLLQIPEHLSSEILQLIKGLLREDPKQRFGCRGKGYVCISDNDDKQLP